MKTNKQKSEVFYIGRGFYSKSGTMMSSIYFNDYTRCDWSVVESMLAEGHTLILRPATDEEMVWAYKELDKWNKIVS
jgi:hypothetical protein